ncbi:MAG: nucleotide exchange factor GrpE [Candidatus Moranbacteria bacterium]|jgi:molecular chaperone GrpE|nr:nucleotide exchange factor GrpE [Candidatus Moranbacteria bacterium]
MELKKNKQNNEMENEAEERKSMENEVKSEMADDSDNEERVEIETSKEDEYLDGWKRCQADFENYKKRQEESRKDLLRYSTESVVMQVIPVLDNFQSAMVHIPDDQSKSAWVIGIMHIQKQLETVLKENGVDEIEVKVGDNFDTKFHEAVHTKECTTCEEGKKFENKISEIVLKGYRIGERVIRPARVVVE